jgi:voltage-gated potassium channel
MQANTIVVLARDSHDPASDSLTFDITSRLGDMGVTGKIVCEAVRDCNRTRMKKAGAANVLRPIRSYPELLIRTILSPGSEQIVEDLFDSAGEECIRYNIRLTATWADILKSMVDEDIGTPLGYENLKGEVITNAHPQKVVNTAAVFVIVRDDNLLSSAEVEGKVKSRIAV